MDLKTCFTSGPRSVSSSSFPMQRTFVGIFKPDCMENRHVGSVLDRFEKAGFTVVGCKMVRLSSEILREHYATRRVEAFLWP